ncbi:MAG: transcription-repair coupling factor, partial [Elusimicrobia bacterium]|nr:transcription-repair coupling factor [Elusimicrobiota bacterium]
MSPLQFQEKILRLKPGAALKRSRVEARLAEMGYRRVDFIEGPGEYAVRGAVLDLYTVEPETPARVLFDEDSVASLRRVDTASQSAQEMLDDVLAVPLHMEAASARVKDWIAPDSLLITQEHLAVVAPAGSSVLRAGRLLDTSNDDIDFGARPLPPLPDSAAWTTEIGRLVQSGLRLFLFSLNRGEDNRLQEILEGRAPEGACQFLIGPLRRGFLHPALGWCAVSTSEIFSRLYRPSRSWGMSEGKSGKLAFRELRVSDYVVHQDYGLARYRGFEPLEFAGGKTDCMVLEFKGSDKLYIPMGEFKRIQKYAGGEGKRPRLSSLDSRRWEEVKHRVAEGVRELAQEILKLEAARKAAGGAAFPPMSEMEREFADAFPYEETPDQARAIAEVTADMESRSPMDRIVVGDVGFGKTEVAMRAAFKCVAAHKQTAVLAPTTILAEQHYQTFCARFAAYPAKIAVLTRFQSRKEQEAVVQGLADGAVDIVIGTSRLLQRDVRFKDLGLIVIDEEHRFGVKDKDKIRSFRKNADCLSLSATPIPRTLNQAVSGLRDISLIESAPEGRQPILTRVGPWSEAIIVEAVSEELGRGGQVYYVHNRVRSIQDAADRISRLLPHAKVAVVHGQMSGADIEKTMWEFFHKKSDVLVASAIIESGLDIPSANTLLVENAQEFGLAQLYQLRGRVGRESRKACCYLFYPEGCENFSELSEEARKRLEALKEFAGLGAGFRLAMRDLEIRGAGDLLGRRQHGFMNSVGVDLYSQMLADEIARMKGKPESKPPEDVRIDVSIRAFIPSEYLPQDMARLEWYKRLLEAKEPELDALRRRLEDLCGPAP